MKNDDDADSRIYTALRWVVTITLVSLPLITVAQKTFSSKHVTVNDGLPQGFVPGIVQDDDGFIWLGTRDGLARYDGREFKVLYANAGRATNITSNIITCLYHDHQDRIWILHESKAIDVFYPREERFEKFTDDSIYSTVYRQFSPNFITVDSRNQVWLINPGNGVWKVDLNKHRVDHLSRRSHGLLCDTVRGVIETPGHDSWIFTQKGIQQIDRGNKILKTMRFDFPASPEININRNFAAGLAPAGKNSVVIREMNKAFVFDIGHLAVKEIQVADDAPDGIPGTSVPQRDVSGNLYFELKRGLYRYDTLTQSAVKIWDGELEQAQSFLIDRSGVAWFGNSASGVQILNLTSLPFKSYNYTSGFFADQLRLLGIRLDHIPWMNYTRSYQYTYDVQTRYDYDSQENLWVTSGDHAAVIDPRAKTMTELPPLRGGDDAFYFAPMTVSRDTCWRVYSLTGTPVYYDSRHKTWVYPLGKDWKLGVPTNILEIVKIGNTLWVTTKHDGLVSIDLSSGKSHWHKNDDAQGDWPTHELTDLERDPVHDSLLWIGTRAGLVRFNRLTGRLQTFSVKSGLPNNTIYCVAADRKGFLWLSTNKGLCRFDPATYNARNFSGSDGLQGDEFNSFHELTLPDGKIAFGGTVGSTILDPLLIEDDMFHPPVHLTKLKINNSEVDISNPETLALAYDQNFLTFYFAGLQFNNVDKIQYRYRLIGLDKGWNYAGHLGMANYTKIPPGRYVLELNASNTTGLWSKHIQQVVIMIDPPWWKTIAAYVLYVILFAGAVIGYVHYTIHKIRLRNLLELKYQEAAQLRQLDEVKSRFFTNITHEFRTPLTLIISPLERLLNAGDLQEAHKEQLRMIGQNADQLLQLVNQFLDLSKLEAGVARTAVAPAPLRSYIESIVRLFQDAASSKRIDLSFQSELGDELYLIDPEKLERIVNNLLSNAIKFTPAGGSVRVVLGKSTVHGPPPIAIGATADDSTADLISLKIVDTGIGITPESQEKIFDRFYQADDGATGHHAGAGIGLSLVKELTTLLKGTVSVESKVGTGTVFTVTLPLARPVEYAKLTSDNFDQVVATEPLHTDRETKSGPESKPVILIAEDHESLRGFLAEQLGRAYTVVTAADGREAWEKILQIMPALVITDVMMPYLDGISLSKQLRETEQTGHIGLIMLTAKASAESRMEGLQTGANDYIAKPFHFEELQLRVANLLAHQQRQRDYFYSQLVKDNPAPAAGVVENEFLEKAYLFLEDALTSKKSIGVEDVASHFSMSSRTLNRKLQALVGLTANEFMRTYRLSRATVLLRRGATVSEAAYEVGFESSQYFAQCFKTQYKITPTEYIQQHRATINPT